MKPNGSQVVFSGPFSASLTDFVKYKRTLGRNYYGMARMLLRFDTFTKAGKAVDGVTPSKQLIQEWLAPHTGENETSRRYRVNSYTRIRSLHVSNWNHRVRSTLSSRWQRAVCTLHLYPETTPTDIQNIMGIKL